MGHRRIRRRSLLSMTASSVKIIDAARIALALRVLEKVDMMAHVEPLDEKATNIATWCRTILKVAKEG
jgi:hypothetical protein